MYADYTYYEKIYLGKSIPPDEFPGAMRTASSLGNGIHLVSDMGVSSQVK